MNYVCGFMCSYDLTRFLLIRKTHPEWQKGKLNGIGGKIEKKATSHIYTCIVPNHYHQIGEQVTETWLKTEKVIPVNISDYKIREDYETPFEAMIREFHEETGITTTRNRWHCFHIEQFDVGPDGNERTIVYFFAAFGDEAKRQYIGDNKDPMFEVVSSYSLLDLYFADPEDTIYNIGYLIRMIIDNWKNGTFVQLNPQGVNNIP